MRSRSGALRRQALRSPTGRRSVLRAQRFAGQNPPLKFFRYSRCDALDLMLGRLHTVQQNAIEKAVGKSD
jgi:hypothetical protein